MKKEYFVLFGSEDGEPSLRHMSKEEVLELFRPDKYGDYPWGGKTPRTPLAELPLGLDLRGNFGGKDVIIIKGEIVVPRPRQVVTEYEIS